MRRHRALALLFIAHSLLTPVSHAAVLISSVGALDASAVTHTIVGPNSAGTPPNPVAQGTNFGAVGGITIGSVFGTGVLITPTVVLTAAHVVDTYSGSGVVNFNTTGGFVARNVTGVTLHPLWAPSDNLNYDLAYITLDSAVTTATPYPLYTATNEAGQSTVMVGYGQTNDGTSYIKRMGVNEIESAYTFIPPSTLSPALSGSILISDFDSDGTDYMTWFGDSGGPLFIGGAVAGIASFISDSTPSHGDFFGHVRVSSFTAPGGFLYGFVPAAAYVPEPHSMLYGLFGLFGLRLARRRRTLALDGGGDGQGLRQRERRFRRKNAHG
jgi:hypothetical protein